MAAAVVAAVLVSEGAVLADIGVPRGDAAREMAVVAVPVAVALVVADIHVAAGIADDELAAIAAVAPGTAVLESVVAAVVGGCVAVAVDVDVDAVVAPPAALVDDVAVVAAALHT